MDRATKNICIITLVIVIAFLLWRLPFIKSVIDAIKGIIGVSLMILLPFFVILGIIWLIYYIIRSGVRDGQKQAQKTKNKVGSAVDEIKELHSLMEKGIITQKEFKDGKKKLM